MGKVSRKIRRYQKVKQTKIIKKIIKKNVKRNRLLRRIDEESKIIKKKYHKNIFQRFIKWIKEVFHV